MDEKLKKAITQENLTEDTVDAQFCSDWLKGEIRRLFAMLRELGAARDVIEAAREHLADLAGLHRDSLTGCERRIEKALAAYDRSAGMSDSRSETAGNERGSVGGKEGAGDA